MTCPSPASSPPPGLPGEFERHLAHLVTLARMPGVKAYAWDQAKRMEQDPSGLWRGLPEALQAAMRKKADD